MQAFKKTNSIDRAHQIHKEESFRFKDKSKRNQFTGLNLVPRTKELFDKHWTHKYSPRSAAHTKNQITHKIKIDNSLNK